MAFNNEKISERDQAWVAGLVNYENIRAISKWVHRFESLTAVWAVDRERGAYLIDLGGGGSPDDVGRMPYEVLILDGQVVLFNYLRRWTGNHALGIHEVVEVHSPIIPPALAPRSEEIQQLIREGLAEQTHCNPFADGGTRNRPNLVARKNIQSFNVEFK